MAANNPETVEVVEPAFTCVAKGLLGSEGPVFSRDGDFYMVAPEVEKDGKPAGQILRVDLENKTTSLLCSPSVDGYGGIPAGCQFDRNSNLYVADMRLGILKVNITDGSFQQLYKVDSAGDTMQGCNDCSLDYDGNLWVTGPARRIAPHPYERSFEEPFGSVFCMKSSGELIKVATGFYFCNGLAVKHSSDGKPQLLLVAETPTKTIWCFDILAPGQVDNKRVWARLPDEGQEGGPDGMDFDSEGRLLVANWGLGHIEVFSPEGKLVTRIKCVFDKVSNLHFKPKSSEVYVTEHSNHSLWFFNWKTTGRKEAAEL